jgi:hypothetical protein
MRCESGTGFEMLYEIVAKESFLAYAASNPIKNGYKKTAAVLAAAQIAL